MKRGHQEVDGVTDDGGGAQTSTYRKLVEEDEDDKLLAELGYKVRSSSMTDVADKLEKLEMAIDFDAGTAGFGFDGVGVGVGLGVDNNNTSVLSHLASETVHYDPSDLNSWVENMLSGLKLPPSSEDKDEEQVDDLAAIIPASTRQVKRIKISTISTNLPQPQIPALLVEDSQEAGIHLVHALLACANAIHQQNNPLAETLIAKITLLAASQGGAMRKVATYFAGALALRIYHPIHSSPNTIKSETNSSDHLETHFYEACPYLKFAHFSANQAIFEAFAGKPHVHVIDLGLKHGMQWPPLMQALSLRPEGPPLFRLTGIGAPQPTNPNGLEEVGWKLAELAESLHIKFEYRHIVTNSLADLEPYMFDLNTDQQSSTVAVNSVLEFHRLLASPNTIEKVLETVRSLKPAILTVFEQEANHNGTVFVDRFTEALHYYSNIFDSLEGGCAMTTDLAMSEMYLGQQICNVVACEGRERKERHENAKQWKKRFFAAGFEMAPLGSNVFRQASLLLEFDSGKEGCRVEENDGCLMLGWHSRPLFTTSAWRIPSYLASSSIAAVATTAISSLRDVVDRSEYLI